MSLKLSFHSRSRLWSVVVNTGGEAVFVADGASHAVGEQVWVTIEAPRLQSTLTLSATVVALRNSDGAAPVGVVVKFDAASVEACRLAVGAQRNQAVRTQGRVEPRVDCSFHARVIGPSAIEGCTVKSISEHGLTMSGAAVQAGTSHRLQLDSPDGRSVFITGEVAWARPELALAGFRLLAAEPQSTLTVAQLFAMAQNGEPTAKRPAPTGKLVVVADDDPSILDFVSRVVTGQGYSVETASRGDDALALIRARHPNMVILDVLMPGMDGLEVCKTLRADVVLGRTPVVLLSAMGEDRLVAAVESAKADGFLTKPVRIAGLRDLLQKHAPA